MEKFLISTAIPYVNAPGHIGHALEFVQADVLARYHRLKGDEVLLLSGADENALKNVQAAGAAGMPVQAFIDKHAGLFAELARRLNVEFNVFQRGSDTAHHFPSSQKLWQLCDAAGDIYKKSYQGLYCMGCEIFYTPDELNENGECPEHPGRKLEVVAEENYFFRLSKYQEQLISLITSDTLRIVPETRKNEMLSFLKQPLQDISISRSNERAKDWGVPVPGDETQKIYVWFEALNIYQSGVGFGWDEELYKKWWPADVHVIGRGITRFHAVYWPAFLLSAGLPLPKTLFVHGYITAEGQKMSKTLGNVIDPIELIEKYGADPVRYYFLREIPPFEDGDFSYARFEQRYTSDLANGLGNLVARVLTLAVKFKSQNAGKSQILQREPRAEDERVMAKRKTTIQNSKLNDAVRDTQNKVDEAIRDFRLHEALGAVWDLIRAGDAYANETKPWEGKNPEAIQDLVALLASITPFLAPFLPDTARHIKEKLGKLEPGDPLFPRLS